jgi:hypothetical protein
LTVGADGSVVEVHALDEDAAFSSAAISAALKWRFEPATRGGVATSARIRVRVEFAPDAPTPSEGDTPLELLPTTEVEPGEATSDGTRLEASSDQVVDVVVAGERAPPAMTTLTRADVREVPGAFGDPFRAVEVVPGVTPIVSGLPFFYLRGSPPGNVGYFVDSIRVPYLFHFGLGPSVVHPALMSRVDVYPGGYPAKFGRYAGGIIAGSTAAPSVEWQGEAQLRLFDVGGIVEGGFGEGRGTVLLGGRYSYSAALLSFVAPELRVDYRDFQARITYALGPRDTLSLLALGAYDLFGEEDREGNVETQLGTEFYRIDVSHEHVSTGGGTVTSGVTLGFDQSHLADLVNARGQNIAARSDWYHALSEQASLRAGVQASMDGYSIVEVERVDPDDPNPEPTFASTFPSRTDAAIGAYAELRLRLTRAFEATPGLRVDRYFSGHFKALGVEPRLSTSLHLSQNIRLIQAVGVAHQPPAFAVPVPGLQLAMRSSQLQQSLQNGAGVEVDLPEDVTLTSRLFHHVLLNVTDALGSGADWDSEADPSLGSVMGMELALRRPLSRHLGGVFSYTLSRSRRSSGREEFPAAFDRTHVLNAALGYDLGRNWRLGTRLVFYTGVPQSAAKLQRDAPRARNPARDPPYIRVDGRLEKRWPLEDWRFFSLVFEWLNASLQPETIDGNEFGPISIPSIGVEGGF